MNIYDLPIPNFGELEDQAALELILEVRSRRRFQVKRGATSGERPKDALAIEKRNTKSKSSSESRGRVKKFNTPFGKFTKEELEILLANLK